jgi:hypothetical protein
MEKQGGAYEALMINWDLPMTLSAADDRLDYF